MGELEQEVAWSMSLEGRIVKWCDVCKEFFDPKIGCDCDD